MTKNIFLKCFTMAILDFIALSSIAATNIQTGEKVAVKLEDRKAKYPQLLYEARLIKLLNLSKRCKLRVLPPP